MTTLHKGKAPTIDDAYSKFCELIPELEQYRNQDISEADTRVKLIDPVLKCLGWAEPSVRRETLEKEDGTYLDYELRTTQILFVIEAKKNFVEFEIPPGGTRQYRMDGAVSNASNLQKAIKQVRAYAINKGIPFCCVTNGFQYAFFRPTNNIGIHWGHHLLVVFRDIQEIYKRFAQFYEILSHESASQGRLYEAIPLNHVAANEPSRFRSFGAEFSYDTEVRHRNILFPYIRELIKRVFQSLDNEDASPELLEFCYVESARDSSYERGIGELLKEHRTSIPNGAKALTISKTGLSGFQKRIAEQAHVSQQSVTLLLGTVGAGKTTFINRLRKVYAKDIIDDNFVWIYVSFNSFIEHEDNVEAWIINAIERELEIHNDFDPFAWKHLKEIYSREVDSLRDGFLQPLYLADKAQYEIRLAEELRSFAKDSARHVLRVLQYYCKKVSKSPILVLDNADHHSANLQNTVFLTGEKYSEELKCLILLSLREESYWKNKDFGGLSAFHATAFQIAAPKVDQVLAKRFKYALLLADADVIPSSEYVSAELDLDSRQIVEILKVIQQSLLGDDRRCIDFLQYIAPGEIRQVLDLVAKFMTSGHTNITRIVDRIGRGKVSPIGYHEFLQAVMLGDRNYYSEKNSDIINLFAVVGRSDESHFNRIAVIARVMSAVGEATSRGKGFVPVSRIVTDCEELGMSSETCLMTIGFLVQKRLLASDTLEKEMIKAEERWVRGTTAVMHYVDDLVMEFTYIDQTILDTGIGRVAARELLLEASRQISTESSRYKKLKIRLDRTEIYLKYLVDEYTDSSFARAGDKFDRKVMNLAITARNEFSRRKERILQNAQKAFSVSDEDK